MEKKKLVVLTGAGISAESGISTFRDSGGLWEGYDIEEVASPQGWQKNPELVLEFYNLRRRQVGQVQPNAAHKALVQLEEKFDVTIITQNIDDLHERAGSGKILHLHGEITKARSTGDEMLIYNIGYNDICFGDNCDKGFQLRPHIVWFGEMVPMIEPAMKISSEADVFLVIGTSLVVYPAAGLVTYAPDYCRKFLVDKNPPPVRESKTEIISKSAVEGVPGLVRRLLD
jgi:NAD-dependent deacetylase